MDCASSKRPTGSRARTSGAAARGSLSARSRCAASGWRCCRSERLHNRPGSRRVHGRVTLLVGKERDSAVARELNEGVGTGKVSSLGIFDRWAGKLLGSVGLASMLFE
jgi:hypothetical protein